MSRCGLDPGLSSLSFDTRKHNAKGGNMMFTDDYLVKFTLSSLLYPVCGCYTTTLCRFRLLRKRPFVRIDAEVLPSKRPSDARSHLVTRNSSNANLPLPLQIWGHNLQVRHQLNLLTSSLNPSIRSVSWHTSNDKILVGTAGTASRRDICLRFGYLYPSCVPAVAQKVSIATTA